MKAFMEADDILSQVNRNSQKIIVHVTDGVPTRSYAINNFKLGASYESQFEQMKKMDI